MTMQSTTQEMSPVSELALLPATIEQVAKAVFNSFSQRLRRSLNGRQERALKLALNGHVAHKGGRVFSVRSEDGKHAYLVNLEKGSCTCPDYHNGYVCKHRIASYLIEQALAASQPEIPAEAPEPAEDRVAIAAYVLNQAKSDLLHEAIVYATLRHDGQSLPVEVVSIQGEIALVRALPRLEGEKLIPQFPFEGKASSAQVLSRSLTDITFYR